MPEVTVKEYAAAIGISEERLLEQLQEAGLSGRAPEDMIGDDEKSELLGYLRRKHGKDDSSEPRKITLRRKSVSELKVPVSAPGRNQDPFQDGQRGIPQTTDLRQTQRAGGRSRRQAEGNGSGGRSPGR